MRENVPNIVAKISLISKDDNSQWGKEKGALAQTTVMGASGAAGTMTNLAVHKTAQITQICSLKFRIK